MPAHFTHAADTTPRPGAHLLIVRTDDGGLLYNMADAEALGLSVPARPTTVSGVQKLRDSTGIDLTRDLGGLIMLISPSDLAEANAHRGPVGDDPLGLIAQLTGLSRDDLQLTVDDTDETAESTQATLDTTIAAVFSYQPRHTAPDFSHTTVGQTIILDDEGNEWIVVDTNPSHTVNNITTDPDSPPVTVASLDDVVADPEKFFTNPDLGRWTVGVVLPQMLPKIHRANLLTYTPPTGVSASRVAEANNLTPAALISLLVTGGYLTETGSELKPWSVTTSHMDTVPTTERVWVPVFLDEDHAGKVVDGLALQGLLPPRGEN